MSQTLSSSQGSLEERYSNILQPIRDLAKNWDVDIAHSLEEYLEDLEKIQITFDEGATTLNFSEAALLIQGSAGVYAKKVEYLHSLVYQVLDLVTQKKKTLKKIGEDGNQDGDDQQTETDGQFLPLDDIPETDGCYTKEQDLISNKGVRPMPQMPTRLIPLEEAEKGVSSLFNKKGEVMGNHGDFNIDIGYITSDGSILLELGDMALLNNIATYRPILDTLVLKRITCLTISNKSIFYVTVEDEIGDGQGDSLVLPAADDHDGDEAEQRENLPDAPRKLQRKKVAFTTSSKSSFDPWVLLDPYEKSKAMERPLLKKKPYRIPPGLEDNTTNKRKVKKEIKVERKPLHDFVDKLFSHRSKFPKNPWKVPDFPELEDAFWKEYKLRDAIKKEEIKKMKKEDCEENEESEDEDNLNEPELPLDDSDDEIPHLQLNPDFFTDHSNLRRLTVFTEAGSSSLMSDDITMSYEDLVQKHVEKFWSSAAEYAQITELSKRVSEWEEKIKPKLEEEEQHAPFDIHKYGTFIIEQLVRGEKKAFRELVKDKLEFEICRYTLATLQLANVYNVELSVIPDKFGSIMDCLYVTLLSTKRHFEDLADYRAPSV
ncbi:unnamed protein product [Lymnaea stagnalis]|uniref:Condensin-2 complex subunit H2 n=1 Tax=Lymnaea stagnalis TaxID=6523 RepID=A0AAV2HPI3_LYMST